jgi:hypothetical protein
MFALNLVLAGVVVFCLIPRIGSHPALIKEGIDGLAQSSAPILAFEIVIPVAAIAAFWSVRLAIPVSWGAFGLHGLLCAAAIALALTIQWSKLM